MSDVINRPTNDEAAVLTALAKLDADILAAAPHLGDQPGDGLATVLRYLIARVIGVDL